MVDLYRRHHDGNLDVGLGAHPDPFFDVCPTHNDASGVRESVSRISTKYRHGQSVREVGRSTAVLAGLLVLRREEAVRLLEDLIEPSRGTAMKLTMIRLQNPRRGLGPQLSGKLKE